MNKFNKRVKELLSEDIISNIAQGAISAAKSVPTALGAAMTAAKDPGAGLKNAYNAYKDYKTDRQKYIGTPFSNQNPPKLGAIAVTIAPVLGTSKQEKNPAYEPDILKRKPNASPQEIQNASKEFLPTKITTILPNAIIYGKITKQLNKSDSTYGIELTDEKGNPTTKYVFAQTESAPYWQIYDSSKLPEDDILIDEAGIPMKLTAIMTGLTKNDVSGPLKNWVDYKQYLNKNKPLNNI
jgi:hypothetical protein